MDNRFVTDRVCPTPPGLIVQNAVVRLEIVILTSLRKKKYLIFLFTDIVTERLSRLENVEIRDVCSPLFGEVSKKSSTLILRRIASLLRRDELRQLLHASLTGIQVLIRGPEPERLEALYALSCLVPRACRRIKVRATEYTDSEACNNFLGTQIMYGPIKKRWTFF